MAVGSETTTVRPVNVLSGPGSALGFTVLTHSISAEFVQSATGFAVACSETSVDDSGDYFSAIQHSSV